MNAYQTKKALDIQGAMHAAFPVVQAVASNADEIAHVVKHVVNTPNLTYARAALGVAPKVVTDHAKYHLGLGEKPQPFAKQVGVRLAKGTPGMAFKHANAISDAVTGAAMGAAGAMVFPLEQKENRTMEDALKDAVIGGAVGGLFGPAVGHEMRKVASPFDFLMPQDRRIDPETHAQLLRAKAALSRAKLVNTGSFTKLEPKAQQAILSAHDAYHDAMVQAALAGKL